MCPPFFWGEKASVGTNREIQNTKRFGERERRRRGLRSHSPLFARVPFFFFSISSHLLSPFFSRACRGKFQETNRERGASVRFSTARIFLLLSLSLFCAALSPSLSLSASVLLLLRCSRLVTKQHSYLSSPSSSLTQNKKSKSASRARM